MSSSSLPIAIVSNKGARRWAAGHPWIYRSDVVERPDAPAGVVTVHDPRGAPLGVALWSPRSEISLRLIDRDAGARIDAEWWLDRIARAATRRSGLDRVTNAYRVVHGEGDGLPSLIVDKYDRWLVIQCMSAGVDAFTPDIVAALERLFSPDGILARNDAALRSKEGLPRETVLLAGDVPRDVEMVEYGVRYVAAPWTGQKTGAFLDQRDSRHRIGTLARGNALDCFSYHGSFALHLAQRAERVVALDASGAALERASENARRNGLSNIEFVEADAFDFLRERQREGTHYDTIVLDPPAFAKNRPSLSAAIRGYKEINLRAMRLLSPGGVLYSASCSFHLTKPLFLEMLRDAAADSGRRVVLRDILGQPVDHPDVLTIPETGYLKGAILEVTD
jgi:23S rRNA (cytosine1962-C5)-methyltransferase